MGISLELPKLTELKPRIAVIGVGGAGGNAINNMIASGLGGVDYIAANTDAQALVASSAERRIQLGANLTEGLGAGSKPEIGEAAAEEAIEEIKGQIAGSHMVFIAAGMGGGTGTGAAAVIARAARELGILTVGIVTKPFQFEGTRRLRTADAGIAELKRYVDTLIVIPNQNLFRIATEKTTFAEAFVLADQVLYSGIACIVDLIVKDGLINLDFADVRTIMSGMGTAMMGTGEATGERRALRAAEDAISNPLLDEVTLKGAKGVLLSIIGGRNMTLYEVDEAASRVRQEVDPEANIIVGATFDEQLGDSIRVAIVASGIGGMSRSQAPSVGVAPATGDPAGVPRLPPAEPAASAHPPKLPPASVAGSSAKQAAPPQPPPLFSGGEAPAPRGLGRVDGPPPPLHRHHTGEPASAIERPEPPRELWRAPGNVVIEEARPTRQSPPHGQPPAAPGDGPSRPADPFQPAPPEDVRRSPARRVPDIEAFPPVGQREFRAKSGRYDEPAQDYRPAPPRRPTDEEAPPRGGLLQRMMGNARKDDSSVADTSDRDTRKGGARLSNFFNRSKP